MIIFSPCERCTIVRPPGAKHGWYTGVTVVFCAEASDEQLQLRLNYLKLQVEVEKTPPLPEARVNVPPDALKEAGVDESQVKIIHGPGTGEDAVRSTSDPSGTSMQEGLSAVS